VGKPDAKKTSEVILLMLSANEITAPDDSAVEDGLYLSFICYSRSHVFNLGITLVF
jgi:hypothetical protein